MTHRPSRVIGERVAPAWCALVLAVGSAGADELSTAISAPREELPFPAAPDEAQLQELPLPDRADASLQELPLPAAAPDAAVAIGNDDVLAMVEAELSEATIVAAIAANETSFDVSPRALVALKEAGASEAVLAAMLEAETEKRQRAEADPARAPPPVASAAGDETSAEALARLTAMIEQLAAAQEAAARAARDAAPGDVEAAPDGPRAWLVGDDVRAALPPTIAEVAFTDERNLGRSALKTLQGFAGKALAFVNPTLGVASTLGGLLRTGESDRTAVWALAGGRAPRELGRTPVFEVEYGDIPGVNPDEYRPAIVRLVPTADNYRLVAAAETSGDDGAAPRGTIIEEPVDVALTRLGRGHFRVAPAAPLAAGEYALVLRPIERNERGRRRKSDPSLGALLGGGTTRILYLTWDFSVPSGA